MRRYLSCLLFTFCFLLFGTSVRMQAQPVIFFVSPSGDDSHPGTQAQPWRTMQRVQTTIQELTPGSQILFERGGVYTGTLTFSAAGSADHPIVLGAYGTGDAPVLSGLMPLNDWVSVGQNRWRADCPTCSVHTDILLMDGQLHAKARFPNPDEGDSGYLYFDAAVGRSQIADDQLESGTDWTGGELVIRSIAWVLDRYPITSHVGDTLHLGTPLDDTVYVFEVGYGYFLQNHPAALDQEGEWVFDAATRQISLYLTSDPNLRLIQTSSAAHVLHITDSSHLLIQDIAVQGSTDSAVHLADCRDVRLHNLQIAFAAQDGLYSVNCTDFHVTASNLTDHLSNGVMIHDCVRCTINDSRVAHIGLWAGMGRGGDGQYLGVEFNGQDSSFERNVVEYIGYNGVRVSGVVVQNNLVQHFALVKVDGGGIYTFGSGGSAIIGNIILYGMGSTAAIPWGTPAVNGIYLDDDSFDITVRSNVIGYIGSNGIVLHNTRNIRVEDNLIFDAGETGIFVIDDDLGDMDSTDSNIEGNHVLNFNQTAPPLHVATKLAGEEWVSRLGTIGNNRYCNPLRVSLVLVGFQPQNADLELTLAEWQSIYGHDSNSVDCSIRMSPYIVGQSGTNRVANDSLEDWGWWSEQPFEVMWEAQAGGSIRALLPAADAALLYTPIGAVTAGQVFQVSFQTEVSRTVPVTLYLQQTDDPWTVTTEAVLMRLFPDQDTYTVYLIAAVTENAQRLTFEFSDAEGGANIALHSIAVQPVEAVPRSLGDVARLEVNASAEARTVTFPDVTYRDLDGRIYRANTSITLAPYSGLILLRQE